MSTIQQVTKISEVPYKFKRSGGLIVLFGLSALPGVVDRVGWDAGNSLGSVRGHSPGVLVSPVGIMVGSTVIDTGKDTSTVGLPQYCCRYGNPQQTIGDRHVRDTFDPQPLSDRQVDLGEGEQFLYSTYSSHGNF